MTELGIEGISAAEPIGSGGFAVVYRAEQPAFRRAVAVKVLNDHDLDEVARNRFERECHALGLLSDHSGIVTVYDGGFVDGHPYLVMEYMAGGSYKDKLAAEGPLGWEEATRVGVDICRALQGAHDAGIVHRDIKPGNILINRFGEVRLGDFGIARVAGSDETQTGIVTTSIAHAPPEVLDRKRPTARSDVYSLASTLFELATGHAPFVEDDDSMMQTMTRILREPVPDLAALGAPAPVAAALERALAKDPAARFGSAADFAAALEGHPVADDDTRDVPAVLPPVPGAEGDDDDEDDEDETVVVAGLPPVPTAPPPVSDADPDPGATPAPAPAETGRRRWWVAAAVLLLLLVGVGAFFLVTRDDDGGGGPTTTADPDPDLVTVPDVVGQSLDAAEADLRNADFDVEVTESPSADVPDGSVIAQDPAGGEEVEAGGVVTVRVSTGPQRVAVPDLSGLTAVEALAALADAGLQATRVDSASNDVPEGSVISQQPSAGTEVDAGSSVTVGVSTGPSSITVPDVIGLQELEATAALEAAGLTVQVVQDFSGAGEFGEVLSVNPPGGSNVLPGTQVTITVVSLPGE